MNGMRDLAAVKAALRQHEIELPSWAFGNTGTRFKVFGQPGVPRTPWEKADDAAQVHRFTGVAPSMAVHIPWDKVDDYTALARYAAERGIRIGAVNANVFQDDDYKLGSVCNPDPRIRKKAVAHLLELRRRHGRHRVARPQAVVRRRHQLPRPGRHRGPAGPAGRCAPGGLRAARRATSGCCLEYKLFEPSFYTTDVPDWGTSLLHCVALGPEAQVVVDTGHHAPGTNIEFIVAMLLRAGRLGGFDFNSRFYADDDLMVGAADPFQLFRIMHEVVKAGALAPAAGVAFMLDQCHNIEPKIPAQIRSVMNVQEATAKALLVDADALAEAQQAGDVLGANAALMDAYNTDVRPLLAELREEAGLEPDPVAAYRAVRVRGEDSGGTDRRGTGGVGSADERRQSRRRTDRAVEPARLRPAEHELRRAATPRPRAPRPTR